MSTNCTPFQLMIINTDLYGGGGGGGGGGIQGNPISQFVILYNNFSASQFLISGYIPLSNVGLPLLAP